MLPDPAGDLRRLLVEGRFRDLLDAHDALVPIEVRELPEVALVAATAATRVREFDRASMLADGAVVRFRSRGDVDGEARAVNLLGAIAFERGALPRAETRFDEALTLARRLQDAQLEARAANNLASVSHLRGHPERALGLFRDALSAYQRLGDRRGAAETYHNLGITYRMMVSWRDAETAVEQAVRHAEMAGDRELMGLAITGRAELDIERGDFVLAARGIARAAELAREADDQIGVAECERLEALLLLRDGNAARALPLAEQALRRGAALGAALLAAESAATAALAARALGRESEASVHRVRALDGYESLGAVGHMQRFERSWSA